MFVNLLSLDTFHRNQTWNFNCDFIIRLSESKISIRLLSIHCLFASKKYMYPILKEKSKYFSFKFYHFSISLYTPLLR